MPSKASKWARQGGLGNPGRLCHWFYGILDFLWKSLWNIHVLSAVSACPAQSLPSLQTMNTFVPLWALCYLHGCPLALPSSAAALLFTKLHRNHSLSSFSNNLYMLLGGTEHNKNVLQPSQDREFLFFSWLCPEVSQCFVCLNCTSSHQ